MEQKDDLMEMVKAVVVQNGDDVGQGEPICFIHKADHENCKGCASELGCAKYAALLLNHVDTMMYEPKDYADYKVMNNNITNNMARILKAKTPEDVREVGIGVF
jgi:hypothetical protein